MDREYATKCNWEFSYKHGQSKACRHGRAKLPWNSLINHPMYTIIADTGCLLIYGETLLKPSPRV